MRVPNSEDIKRIAAQFVQPLVNGSIDAVESFTAKISNLPGFGSGDNSKLTYPYGMVAKPIKGVVAYLLNLQGSLLAPIVLAHIDNKRPIPSAEGEVIFYCSTAEGASFPVKLTLGVDGKYRMDASSQVRVVCDDIVFNGASTKLGSLASSEPLILGNTYKIFYNAHTHIGNLGIATGPPLLPMGAAHLSTKSFTEL